MAASFARAVALVVALVAAPLSAAVAQGTPFCFQSQAASAPPEANAPGPVDIITPHITDSHDLDAPYYKSPWVCKIVLPRWAPVHIGPLTVDLSPTKHVVWLIISSIVCCIALLSAASYHRRHLNDPRPPAGWAAGIESMVLYLRDTVVIPNVGPHGDAYTSYILTVFFFVLFANLGGLIPYGSTATGNISVTLTLALVSFLVIEVSGMITLGSGYWSTIFYWNHDLPIAIRIPMALLMTPIEIVSKFTKPFALTIRLFANMTAGHVVLLALISLVFTFGSIWIAAAPVVLGVAVSLLEIFVAFLQAFIFALLTAVFIGQIRQAAH